MGQCRQQLGCATDACVDVYDPCSIDLCLYFTSVSCPFLGFCVFDHKKDKPGFFFQEFFPHKAEEPFLRLSLLYMLLAHQCTGSIVGSSYGCRDSALIMFGVSAAERCTSSQQSREPCSRSSGVFFDVFFSIRNKPKISCSISFLLLHLPPFHYNRGQRRSWS